MPISLSTCTCTWFVRSMGSILLVVCNCLSRDHITQFLAVCPCNVINRESLKSHPIIWNLVDDILDTLHVSCTNKCQYRFWNNLPQHRFSGYSVLSRALVMTISNAETIIFYWLIFLLWLFVRVFILSFVRLVPIVVFVLFVPIIVYILTKGSTCRKN